MKLVHSLAPTALALILSVSAAAAAEPNCMLNLLTTVDMEMTDSGRITIPVNLNGSIQQMMVDTGAVSSLVDGGTVKELKLPTRDAKASSLIAFGGGHMDKLTDVKQVSIGDLKANGFAFFIDDRGRSGTAGLIGLNLQYKFDIDFDFAKGKLTYFAQDHCPGKVVYWTHGSYGAVPFKWVDGHIQVPIEVDGVEVNGILDTGATDTVMSLEKAVRRLGLDREEADKNRRRTFKTLSFGNVQVINPSLKLIPDKESVLLNARDATGPTMVLGMTVLRQLHMYIAFGEQVIYVTPATQYK